MPAAADQRADSAPRVGIAVFEDINYGGRSQTFTNAVPDLRRVGFNDRISSLRIARGESWEVCEDPNYSGRCETMRGDEPNLPAARWNDKISSMRRVRDFGRDDQARRDNGGLQLFSGSNYSGQQIVIFDPVANLKDMNFNDRAVSVRVPAGESWEICVGADYDDCRVVSADVPDLGRLGVSRLVSSARPRVEARGFFTRRSNLRIVLYDSPGFRGRSVTITEAEPNVTFFDNRAGSLEVQGGRWEVCDRPRYGGRCVTLSDDVRDLRTLGLNDRISSIRPR